MNSILKNLKQSFQKGDTLIKLIYVNVAVFIVLKLVSLVYLLFKIDFYAPVDYLALPAYLTSLLHHFWTPVTYMFVHEGFMHILFNMIALFWFGKLFLIYFSDKQLLALYLFGGLLGALAYIGGYNLIPYYNDQIYNSVVIGASGSIMAIIVATAFRAPNSEIQLMFLGRIKLMYIAIAFILLSMFGTGGSNAGGEIVHLGGAFAGYLFVSLQNKGKDITPFFNKIIDFLVTLFRPRKKKFKTTVYNSAKMSDEDFNRRKAHTEEEINKILDKIKTSGYESLTQEEKQTLFNQKK